MAAQTLEADACPDGMNVIVGTEGVDELVGTNEDDCIVGLGGNDVLIGGNGNDLLIGGDGDDTLNGGNGKDSLIGEEGNDVLIAGNGIDSASGGPGNDVILGEQGKDTLNGDSGNDIIIDDNGAGVVDGGDGDDACNGPGCESLPNPQACTTDAECDASQYCIAAVGFCVSNPIDTTGLACTGGTLTAKEFGYHTYAFCDDPTEYGDSAGYDPWLDSPTGESLNRCTDWGGYPAIITSDAEWSFIKSNMNYSFGLGLSRNGLGPIWGWDYSPVIYSDWGLGEPDVTYHAHYLARRENDFRWDAVAEIYYLGYVCEKNTHPAPFELSGSTVALYHLDEGAGTVIADATTNGLDGTLEGGPTWTSAIAKGLHLDGNGDYLKLPDSVSQITTNEVTVDVWVKFEFDNGGVVFDNGNMFIAYEFTDELAPNELKLTGGMTIDGTMVTVESELRGERSRLQVGEWYRVSLAYGERHRLGLYATKAADRYPMWLSYPTGVDYPGIVTLTGGCGFATVGTDCSGSSNYLTGTVDEVRISDDEWYWGSVPQ